MTITRTGTGTITKLAATLSGTNADDFILGVLNATTLDSANTSAEFTIKPKDGLASGTYTATVTVTADNNVSQEFDISFTVNTLPTPEVSAPGVPTGVTATGGNAKVILSWNSAARSTGYKIFQSTIPDSYGTALTTVSGGVYSYEVTGLTNGVTYYFVIKATNEGGDSPDSKEVSATPINVPGVPTNVTATASNGQATVSFIPPADNGGSAITRYTVTSSPGDITAADLSTTITVKGLSNGVDYTFTVTASNAAGTSLASTASNAVTPYIPSGGAPDRDSTPSIPDSNTPPSNTGFDILVNGKTETAATATTTQEAFKPQATYAASLIKR